MKIFKQRSVNGFVTYSEYNNGLLRAVFECKVHITRDGNIYMQSVHKRVKNKPQMRQKHSSPSLGKDKRYYFVFSLFAEGLHLLRGLLIKEARVVVEYILNTLPFLGDVGTPKILIGVLLIIVILLLFSKPNKYPIWTRHIISILTDTIVKYLLLCHLE